MSESTRTESSRWIWPFEILERIGEGGMGHVFRARYVPRNLDVAVKMLPEDVADETTLARFEREMEVLKELRHPNIVRSFGGVSEDKQRFYAMELMPGGTLEDELHRKGRLTWEQVIEYSLQMCAALDFLHSKGVVHRDVKPSNFLKAADGRIKLSDFGLASVIAQRKITVEGRTAGTFLYMAPEQIRGDEITPRTDLYALGCVLFELLTGRPPLVGDTPAATLHKHCKQTPPRVTEFALDCPPALERLVARLLEKDPERRPTSAIEVAQELRTVSQTIVVKEPRNGGPFASDGDCPVADREKPLAPKTEVYIKALRPLEPFRKYATIAWLAAVVLLGGWVLSLRFQLARSEQAHDLWMRAAVDSSVEVRRHAIVVLGELRQPAGLALLAERLKSDTDPQVRELSAAALGRAGDAARAYIPVLHRAMKGDESQQVRLACGEALRQLQGK
jgi:serine/threonine protein kinase